MLQILFEATLRGSFIIFCGFEHGVSMIGILIKLRRYRNRVLVVSYHLLARQDSPRKREVNRSISAVCLLLALRHYTPVA